jgi:hypothetical protein
LAIFFLPDSSYTEVIGIHALCAFMMGSIMPDISKSE